MNLHRLIDALRGRFRHPSRPWRGEDGRLWETCTETGAIRLAAVQYPLVDYTPQRAKRPEPVLTAIEKLQAAESTLNKKAEQVGEEARVWFSDPALSGGKRWAQ